MNETKLFKLQNMNWIVIICLNWFEIIEFNWKYDKTNQPTPTNQRFGRIHNPELIQYKNTKGNIILTNEESQSLQCLSNGCPLLKEISLYCCK